MRKVNVFLDVLAILAAFLAPVVFFFIWVSLNSTLLVTAQIRIALLLIEFIFFLYLVVYGIRRFSIFRNIVVKVLLILMILSCFGVEMLFYGPVSVFRNWLIITAMDTMNHNYLCKWFYNDEQIAKAYNSNYIVGLDGGVDESLIDTEHKAKVESVKKSLKTVIAKSDGILVDNDQYLLIKDKTDGQDTYIAIVYDPAKVKLGHTSSGSGEYVTTMAENAGALLAINGGGFYDPNGVGNGGQPLGLTIADGKVISTDLTSNVDSTYAKEGGLVGFNEDNVLVLDKNMTAEKAEAAGIRDAVTWGPYLVVNGESLYVKGNGGKGYGARAAIGQRADGAVILLVVDANFNRTRGASMKDLANIMLEYGAVNAANMDGGTSTCIVAPKSVALKCNKDAMYGYPQNGYMIFNEPVNGGFEHATRPIANCWMVMP